MQMMLFLTGFQTLFLLSQEYLGKTENSVF